MAAMKAKTKAKTAKAPTAGPISTRAKLPCGRTARQIAARCYQEMNRYFPGGGGSAFEVLALTGQVAGNLPDDIEVLISIQLGRARAGDATLQLTGREYDFAINRRWFVKELRQLRRVAASRIAAGVGVYTPAGGQDDAPCVELEEDRYDWLTFVPQAD